MFTSDWLGSVGKQAALMRGPIQYTIERVEVYGTLLHTYTPFERRGVYSTTKTATDTSYGRRLQYQTATHTTPAGKFTANSRHTHHSMEGWVYVTRQTATQTPIEGEGVYSTRQTATYTLLGGVQ